MSKKNKKNSGNKEPQIQKIILVTTIMQLITALIDLITKLIE